MLNAKTLLTCTSKFHTLSFTYINNSLTSVNCKANVIRFEYFIT